MSAATTSDLLGYVDDIELACKAVFRDMQPGDTLPVEEAIDRVTDNFYGKLQQVDKHHVRRIVERVFDRAIGGSLDAVTKQDVLAALQTFRHTLASQ
jgi:hypothetical protein